MGFPYRVSTRKAYEPIKQENQVHRKKAEDALRQELLQMRQDGMSNNGIAKKKKLDLRRVDKLIGKNTEKAEKREVLKQQVIDMTEAGETASEISKDLGISISTVRRIRAKGQ